MFEIINNAVNMGYNFIERISPGPVFTVVIISIMYVVMVNSIIKIFTNQEEKKRLKAEMEEIKHRIKESRGPYNIFTILKTRDRSIRKQMVMHRKANKPLITEERKKLKKLARKVSWDYGFKPMLFYFPLVILIIIPLRNRLAGVITQPLIGVTGIFLITLLIGNYFLKRTGKSPLIDHKFPQFIFGFAGIRLLFESSLNIFWFYLITILVFRVFANKIMGVD